MLPKDGITYFRFSPLKTFTMGAFTLCLGIGTLWGGFLDAPSTNSQYASVPPAILGTVILAGGILLLGLGVLSISWAFRNSPLVASPDGLRQRAILGDRWVRWDEVTSIAVSNRVIVVRSPSSTINISPILMEMTRNEISESLAGYRPDLLRAPDAILTKLGFWADFKWPLIGTVGVVAIGVFHAYRVHAAAGHNALIRFLNFGLPIVLVIIAWNWISHFRRRKTERASWTAVRPPDNSPK